MNPGSIREPRRRRLRIERLLGLARRVADPTDVLGVEVRARLLKTSGLSREGVELALTRHLESNPSEVEVASLLGPDEGSREANRPPRCFVVIAANVCTSALRSIAVALATSPTVLVRPSSRDPALAEILVRELADDEAFRDAGGSITLVNSIDAAPLDELHIYGSDETIAALRAATPAGVVVRGHGTGFGVALIGSGANLAAAARALAEDVVPFDQRGCLSPRIALVEGDASRAAGFFEALDSALACSSVPRGALDEATRAELAMYQTSIEAVGSWSEGPSYAVGLDPAPRSLLLAPAARVVHIAAVSVESAARLLSPIARYVAAIGVAREGGAEEGGAEETTLDAAISAITPRARRSSLGAMQRPPLDGPVDRRIDNGKG